MAAAGVYGAVWADTVGSWSRFADRRAFTDAMELSGAWIPGARYMKLLTGMVRLVGAAGTS